MRHRIVLAVAALSAVGLAAPAALAASTPVMDGKKVKQLVLKANGGVQDHDDDNANVLDSPDRYNCSPDRCAKLKFVYQPAKGVKDGLMFTVTWSNPASDIDLFVGQVGKSGDISEVASCGGGATTSERVYVPASGLRSGKTYVLIADFYRSLNEDVMGKVNFGANETKATVPAEADGVVYPVNCTL